MFKYFRQFLKESEAVDDLMSRAKELVNDEKLKVVLNDCLEGKYPSVQVVPTPGADSYVGVALNDGAPLSEIFHTSDPVVALVAIVIRNTNKEDVESIKSELTLSGEFLNYSVFAGERPMTAGEIAKRFNFSYKVPAGDAVPFFTSTPISRKTY